MSANASQTAEPASEQTAKRRAALEKALRERLRQAAASTSTAPETDEWPQISPDRGRRYEPFPLTEIQQAYWLGRDPGFELGGVGIHGYFEVVCRNLDLPRLNRAWQRVIERHDMMRAVILQDGGQRILESVPPYEIAVIDLRGASESEAEATLRQLRGRLSHQVFSPEIWPLFEIVALRMSDEQTRLLFSEDAIHIDLVSSAMILDDWLRFYTVPQTELPPLDLSYRDYVLALGRVRDTTAYRAASEYWRERIEKLPPPPDLPRVPLTGPPRFERIQTEIPPDTWDRVRRRVAKVNLSASALLLAVYAEVLGRWSSSLRFTLNVTVYNRLPLHPQVSQIAGDFTSMALLEVDRTQSLGLLDHARILQRQVWADLEHHSLNGIEILRQFAARHGASGGAVAPYVFTGSLGSTGYRGLQQLGSIDYAVTQTPQVLIDEQVFEEGGALVLSWDVVSSAFPAGMAAEMFRYGTDIIARLAKGNDEWEHRPEGPAIISPALSQRPEPPGLLHEFFDRRASERPNKTAVITPSGTLTYGELASSTNQMARLLRSLGAAPDRPIGILANRGWQAIAAAIAIGKAGAPYLPLDPSWPHERRSRIFEDASVGIVIADEMHRRACNGLRVVTFDDAAGELIEGPGSLQDPSNLAYVLYTSGSTGSPKGVLIEQHSVVNRMQDVVERCGLSQDDAAFAVTALHHDLSVFDMFGILAFAGGSLVVPDADVMQDPSQWSALMAEARTTVWNSAPAFLEMLLRCTSAGQPLSHLRLVMLSGDRISPQLPARIRGVMPNAKVFSLGGPTETTVWDIWHPIQDEDAQGERIPYGVPLTNAAYYVMKDNLEECPVWTHGELCIAGAGLARGYLNSPELTAERFVSHPQTGERLYRSGDLGRRLPNGDIEILGRRDRQVKIRGHRIELDEVETVLSSAPGVASAAVDVEAADGGPELAAFIVRKPPRMEDGVVDLGPAAIPAHLDQACARRCSSRQFLQQPAVFADLATMLGCLANYASPSSMLPRHLYPSAGTLYGVRVYVHAKAGRIEGLGEGWYSYAPDRHSLNFVSSAPLDASAHHERNRDIFNQCAFSILLVGDFPVIEATYPDWARDFALIEAGAMSQLLMMAAGCLGLGLCPIGGMDHQPLAEFLAPGYQLLHSHCGGRVRETKGTVSLGRCDTAGRADADIRKWLKTRLPKHMIPSRLVFLDHLPLNANGKVDRAALKDHLCVERAPRQVRAAEGDLIRIIRQAWEYVLGRTGISDHDRIFDMAADSFHTVQAWLAIKQNAGVEFELVEMFRNPTVAMLAEYLSAGDSKPEIVEGRNRAAIRRRIRGEHSVRAD